MKKKILFALSLFACLAFAAAFKPAVKHLAVREISSFCRKNLAGSFAYKSCSYNDGALVFSDMEVLGKRPVKAKKLILRYNFPFHILVEMESPEFHSLEPWMLERAPFFCPVTLEMRQACFEKYPGSLLDLSLYAGSSSSLNGSLALGQSNGSVKFCAASDHNAGFSAVFEKTTVAALLQFLEPLNIDFDGFSADSGILDGTFSYDFSRSAPEISLRLTDAAVQKKRIGMQAVIEEVCLDVSESSAAFSLKKPAAIAFLHNHEPVWMIENLQGGATLSNKGEAFIDFHGKSQTSFAHHEVSLQGEGQTFGDGQATLDFALLFSMEGKQDAALTLSARQLGAENNAAEIRISHLAKEEFSFIQAILSQVFSDWKEIRILDGSLDATAHAYLQGWRLVDLKIEELVSKNLKFELDPLDLYGSIKEVSGNFAIDLSHQNPLETLNADLVLEEGKIKLVGLNDKVWRLKDFQTNLVVKNGAIESSVVKGEFAGLAAVIEIDWLSRGDAVQIDLSGPTGELDSLVSDEVFAVIQKGGKEDHLAIHAKMRQKPQGAKVEGVLEVYSQGSGDADEILFGFDLEKCSEKLWKAASVDEQVLSFWQYAGKEAMQQMFPSIASPSIVFESNWMRSESGACGFVMRNGWFYAEKISLEKYVEPFVFSNGNVSLKGVGDFKGFFDHQRLVVSYSTEAVVLDGPALTIEVPSISGASHFYDFCSAAGFGMIPIKDGTYIEKGSGLLFTEVQALVFPEARQVRVPTIRWMSGGLYMEGKIEADMSGLDQERLLVDMKLSCLQGSCPQLQDFFKHFSNDSWPLSVPLSGDITLGDEGAVIRLDFEKERCDVAMSVSGGIRNGSLPVAQSSLSLSEIDLDFTYCHEEKKLEIVRGQGVFLNGEQHLWPLVLEKADFTDCKRGVGDFDFWIGDQKSDRLRLAAKSGLLANGNVGFELDFSNSHLANVAPQKFFLEITEDLEVSGFDFAMAFDLDRLWLELKELASAGLLPLGDSFSKRAKQLEDGSGSFWLEVGFRDDSGEFFYKLTGEKVRVDELMADNFSLKGKTKGGKWSIDELILDDWTATLEAYKNQDGWQIPFAGIQWKNALVMGVESASFDADGALRGNVKLLEVDLQPLCNESFLQSFSADWKPFGKIRAAGEIHASFGKRTHFFSHLTAKFTDWGVRGHTFEDGENIQLTLSSDEGIEVKKLPVAFEQNRFVIDRFHYDATIGDIYAESVLFDIPARKLRRTTETLRGFFPEILGEEAAEVIVSLKEKGSLKGAFGFESSGSFSAMRVSLEDGIYNLNGKEWDLRQFVLEKDPFEWHAKGAFFLGNKKAWFSLASLDPFLEKGKVFISDSAEIPEGSLCLDWEKKEPFGISILSAKGYFSGMQVDAALNGTQSLSPQTLYLLGNVEIDPVLAAPCFSPEIAGLCAGLDLAGTLSLNGAWEVWQEEGAIRFAGEMRGGQVCCNGYQFQQLFAKLQIHSNQVEVSDLEVVDPAGELRSPSIRAIRDAEGSYHLSPARIVVSQFRPSLLQPARRERPKSAKPLVFREIVINGLQGPAADPKKWTANGRASFQNRAKQRFANTILKIPSDLISRIGLDLAVLNPVTGQIEFRVGDGRIYLTKLKDVYSEGKLSKFNLAGSNYKSFMDFEGNLHVQIRMRQYNLLFKLAELLTVTIQGNLSKPSYSLQSGSQGSRKKKQYSAKG